MSRVRLIVLAGEKRDPFLEAAKHYLGRTGRRFDAALTVLRPQKRGKGHNDAEVRREEARALEAASEGATRVALDAGGALLDTPGFADRLEELLQRGRPVAFLIGGATGLDPALKDRADAVWSLSPLTFPHRLAALVLAEQVYRAAERARGGPYAK